MEYGISLIIYNILVMLVQMPMQLANLYLQTDPNGTAFGVFAITYLLFLIMLIPLAWFMLAQGAKRCHDRGCSGWWQLVPFYYFWLLFADGVPGSNEYGENPKGRLAENNDTK